MFYGFVSLSFFTNTVSLLTITFMLSCSCQVDSVLNTVTTRGMSFRVFSVNFCEGFITKFGDEFSKSPNLVNNTSLNLVTNLWLTESGEISITKFGDEFVAHRIL